MASLLRSFFFSLVVFLPPNAIRLADWQKNQVATIAVFALPYRLFFARLQEALIAVAVFRFRRNHLNSRGQHILFAKNPPLVPMLQTTDVWWNTIVPTNGKEKAGYATQKPLAIVERIVCAHSNPGDVVLDFFAGSGTAGVAAAKNGRHFVLVDENPQAFKVMQKRLTEFYANCQKNNKGEKK